MEYQATVLVVLELKAVEPMLAEMLPELVELLLFLQPTEITRTVNAQKAGTINFLKDIGVNFYDRKFLKPFKRPRGSIYYDRVQIGQKGA